MLRYDGPHEVGKNYRKGTFVTSGAAACGISLQRRFWVDVGVQERSRRKRLERAVTLEEELERDLERVQEQLNALGLSRREMVGFWTELRERIDDEPPLQFGASMQSHETN